MPTQGKYLVKGDTLEKFEFALHERLKQKGSISNADAWKITQKLGYSRSLANICFNRIMERMLKDGKAEKVGKRKNWIIL